MPCRARKSLANALLPSSWAAAAVGPKIRRPSARKRSTTPATSGPSGPTTVTATPSLRASASSPSMSLAATSTLRHRGSFAVPALPGATSTSVTRGDCASFHASACSRPPEPMTRSFMPIPGSASEENAAGDFDALAVDPAVLLREQRRDGAADVIREADAPERGLLGDSTVDLGAVADHAAAEVGLDRAGRHDIHRDAARTQFLRHVARQHFDAAFHRRVGGVPG